MKRKLLVASCLVLSACFSGVLMGSTATAAHDSSRHGEILWDSFGVPHVYAKTESGVMYGFGWAQAQSHADLILKLYGEARGRAAEYWGDTYIDSDKWVVNNDIYTRAGQWYRQQTPQFKADLDAFAAGFNAYAAAHPEAIAADVRAVLPIDGVDVVAHAERLMNFVYIASSKKVLQASVDHSAGGSNGWAVAPSRVTDGHTLLLANPHLPWGRGFFTYYEAELNGPGIHMYGATQIGLPVLRFAFNDHLGFTNTVNTMLGETTYRLSPVAGGYRYDGKVLPFRTVERTLKVKTAAGGYRALHFTSSYSVQGPVFHRADGTVVALKVAGLDRPGMLQQYWDMGKAQNFAQFLTVLKRVQVPMFNIVYGDDAGHIMYLDNGILPRHEHGDLAYWSGLVPGDTSATLWHQVHSYDELPKVIDPASGFVQNTNDPPWLATYPRVLNPANYPPYVAPVGPMTFRSQMSVDLLKDHPRISFDDFVALKLDTRSLLADRILPDLLTAARASGKPELAPAIQLLANWNHHDDADSRGALLFETWAKLFLGNRLRMTSQLNFAHPWSLQDPLNTPYGLKDPAQAVAMLVQAVQQTKQLYGALDRPFGEVSRFHLGNVNLPGNGGFGDTGIFRTISWGPMHDGERVPVHGETWVSLVEFSHPLKAEGLLSYGNASQPGSHHVSDQLRFLASKRLRTLWTTRQQVEKHVESVTHY